MEGDMEGTETRTKKWMKRQLILLNTGTWNRMYMIVLTRLMDRSTIKHI